MGRIIAIANQKGGVGKTTTAVNLSACTAVAERPTLLIDIDPQANATSGLGIAKDDVRTSVYEVLIGEGELDDAILPAPNLPFLDVLPAHQRLIGAEIELVNVMARETRLKRALEAIRNDYHYIFIDCPPSLGLLTVNTLTAADSVIVPIQCEYYALEGLGQLLNSIRLVQRNLNSSLRIEGILLTMYDGRLNLARQVAEEARRFFGDRVYESMIPRNVRLGEAPSFGQPIILYDILSSGSEAYIQLAKELMFDGTEEPETAVELTDAAAGRGAGLRASGDERAESDVAGAWDDGADGSDGRDRDDGTPDPAVEVALESDN